MNTPRSTRRPLPSMAALGLSHPRAEDDLRALGWLNEEHLAVLWDLSMAGDPNLCLNSIIRLYSAVKDYEPCHVTEMVSGTRGEKDEFFLENIQSGTASNFLTIIENNPQYRLRLFSLLGGSSALGDHLIAHPEEWVTLAWGLPRRADMFSMMLSPLQVYEEGQDTRTYYSALKSGEAIPLLRNNYRSILMRIAAVDLAGSTMVGGKNSVSPMRASFSTVSALLTDAADAALTAALAVAAAEVYSSKDEIEKLAVIAMGKCGARELNYISDVDVIFAVEEVSPTVTRLAGEFVNIGTRAFFEVDAALRPEGKRGALVRTVESHVQYYKKWAQTWEFQALLKARPLTGDPSLGIDYISKISPFVWEAAERPDFVSDVQAMRRRVIDNVPDDMRERELKLGPGGLRDVEFAVQLLQMVHGRVDATLRVPSTVEALNALIQGGYIGRDDGAKLIENYEYIRLLEHCLQMQRMKRTHTLPDRNDPAYTWLARCSGARIIDIGARRDTRIQDHPVLVSDQLTHKLKETSVSVKQLNTKLFYRPLLNFVVNVDVDALRLKKDAAQRQLSLLGYIYPDRAYEHLSSLASGSTRKAKIQAMLLPTLLGWLGQTVDPDAGLLAYRRLSERAENNSWFLRLLRDEGVVGQRLMHILGTSPYAAELFLSTPDAVQLLRDGTHGPRLLDKDPHVVGHSLVAAAARHQDPDQAITVARSLRRVELVRLASADLLGMISVPDLCLSLSRVWNAVLEAALQAEIRAWELTHNAQAPASIAVIGMGRLGGGELGFGSDADVLFVCDPYPHHGDELQRTTTQEEGTHKDRSEEALKWSIGICDRLRQRLARPSQDPPLEVDLDLRPEGRNGPSVRTLDSYQTYYERWADTWELQALLRASWIAGNKDLGLRFLRMIDTYRYPAEGADENMVREVRRMKARVDSERLPRGADRNTHTKLGRGGLTDIEWTVQLLTMQYAHRYDVLHNTSTLESLKAIGRLGIIAEEQVEILEKAWITATQARNAIVLVKGKRKDQLPHPGPQLALVAAAAQWNPQDSQAFLDHYLRTTRRARAVVDSVFWGEKYQSSSYEA